jgi:ATP-dependent Clp protease ATP-binding subunit ClpC
VLFDEVEKAHPDVMHMLLQILEEGRLTDSLGRNVDFRNTVVILTSNLGVDIGGKSAGLGFAVQDEKESYERLKSQMMEDSKRYFKPEFLNRFDDIVVFRQLTKEDVEKILDLEMVRVRKRIEEKGGHLMLSKPAREFLVDKGFDTALGARPLRRAIERYLEDPLADEILRGRLNGDEDIEVICTDERLAFRQKRTEVASKS